MAISIGHNQRARPAINTATLRRPPRAQALPDLSYFVIPAVRPATICLVASRNSTTSGIVVMTRPA